MSKENVLEFSLKERSDPRHLETVFAGGQIACTYFSHISKLRTNSPLPIVT